MNISVISPIFKTNLKNLYMKKLFILLMIFLSVNLLTEAQKKIVNVPDLPGYVTLKCDFHIHTVFSDGNVWPTVRVDEAVRDGLDALAITDHIEYTPKKNFIPVDHNGAWKVAEAYARERNLILVHGTEITRSMPPGHFNALFIKDASTMTADSVMDVFEEAIRQGAFLQWNHPGWRSQEPDGIPKLYRIHKLLLEKKWMHGIEFFNDSEYYPKVMTFCRDYNLTVIANSDNHAIVSEKYKAPENPNRPMTLVFAKERSHDALREAMFAGRTLAYFGNSIAGKKEYALPFFYQCIAIGKPFYKNEKSIFFEISNNSDIPFYLVNGSQGAPSSITLQANSVTRVALSVKAAQPLVYDVRNIITGENEVLKVEIKY